MRVTVNYSDGQDPMVKSIRAADFSVLDDGSLFIKEPNNNTVMFNARSWYRVDVDNSGQ